MEITNQANSVTHGLPRRDSAEMLNTSLKPNEPSYYDDLYDFNDIPLDDPAAVMAHMYPNGLLNTDEDTDEDINLDYGYGYDYERVIKDRLKAANDAFASDSATPLKKNTRVSFDTTVTAIDDPEVPEIESKNTENNNRIHFQIPEENIPGMNDQSTDLKASTKFALPLNDTVEKENPDDFANKLRAANARYDALTSSLDHTHTNNHNINNESQIVPTTKKSFNESDSNKTVKFLSTETNNINISSNNNQKADSPKLQNNNNNNSDSVNINSTKTDNTKSNNYFMQKSSSPSTSPELNKPKTTQFANILIESNKKDNSRSSSTSPNNDDNKSNTITTTTTTVKINGTSSPLQKTSTSPTSTTKPSETKKSWEGSVPTIDDKSDTKAKAPQEKTGTGQKVVLEKDGQFLLVDSDEYTATEKFRSSAEKIDQSTADSKKSTPLIPRPPERPKTSNGRSTNVYTIKQKSTTEEKRVSSANSSSVKHVRQSRSADAAGRSRDKNSKSPIEFDRTPEYAQFYKSPYAFPKKKQPYDKNDEHKKKEELQKKEEERQQENEIAFKYWLEKKEKERRESKEKQNKDKKERSTSSTRSSTQSRPILTFDDWLKQKKTIILEQRKEQQKVKQYEYEDRLPPHTIEERQAVFRDWLRKKYREKHQAKELEKLERKKWATRCRKSRKHQRLSQAIELAQAYGYTSYYYTTGFNY